MSDFLEKMGEELFLQETVPAHVFSQKYEEGKKKILEQERSRKKKKFLSMAAGIVGVCCLVPVTVFGGQAVRAYFMQHQDNGSYADTYTFTKADQTEDKVYYVKVEAAFPKEYISEPSGNASKVYRTQGGKCVTLSLYYAKSQNEIVQKNVLDSEEMQINGHRAVYSKVHTVDFNQNSRDKNVLIFFEEYGYAVEIAGSSSVERQELLDMCSSISLRETTYEDADQGIFYTGEQTILYEDRDVRRFDTVQPGQKFTLKVADNDMNFLPVQIWIEDVCAVESLEEIENGVLMNFQTGGNYIAADGTLLPYERRKIRIGDGVNTLSEVVASERVEQQLIKLTYTVFNESDTDRNLSLRTVASLYCEGAGEGYIYDRGDNDLGGLGRPIMMDNTETVDFFIQEDMNTPQKCVAVPAGQSRTVQAVYAVDKDQMKEMYFCFADLYGKRVVFRVEE